MLNDIKELSKRKTLPNNSRISLNIAMDVGSTETRTIEYSDAGTEAMPLVDVEPSTFAKLEYGCDISDLKSINSKLMDNFEVRLRTIQEEKYTILKGTLAKQYGAEKRSSSAKSKMEQDSTIINIHAACIMNVIKLMQAADFNLDTGTIVDIKLTLALPPEDTDPVRIEKLRSQFEGVYEADLPRIGCKFLYSILPEDVAIVSECNATAMYYMCMTMSEEALAQGDNVIVLECGGRSSSAAVIKEGTLASRLHRNFDIGGTNLLQILIDCLAENTGSSKISLDAAERVLCTGYLRKGSIRTEVYDVINKSKEIFAKKLVDKLLEAIEGAEMSTDDIQTIVVSGRIFGELVDEAGQVRSPSLGAHIKQIYQSKWCSGTEVIRIKTKYPIPEGLVIYRMGTQ